MEGKLECNICREGIERRLVRLKCNPQLHYFCEECITDWYKQLKKDKYKYEYQKENEFKVRMCPICRLDGGLLPLFHLDSYIPSIHEKKLYKEFVACKFEKKGGVRCKRRGCDEYDDFCLQHFEMDKKKKLKNEEK